MRLNVGNVMNVGNVGIQTDEHNIVKNALFNKIAPQIFT